MEKKQTFKILTLISSVFQKKFEFGDNKEDDKMTVNVWHRYLKSYDYELIQVVVDKLIINKPEWPPTVGEIIQEAEKIKRPDILGAGEAWDQVLKVVRVHGVLYGTKEARNSLDRRTQLAVKAIGGLIAVAKASDKELSFLKNDFKKEYRAVTDKEVKENYLPVGLNKKIKFIKENNKLLEGGQNEEGTQ